MRHDELYVADLVHQRNGRRRPSPERQNHGPFGENNLIIPNGHWHYGPSKVPVGFGRDGQPVFVNFEFVDGTRGAHVSISGVSGIATKTSFAMFLLHSITNCGVLAWLCR